MCDTAPSPQRLIEEAAMALGLGRLLPLWRHRGKVPRRERARIAAQVRRMQHGRELRPEDYDAMRPIYGRLPLP